MIEKIVGLKVKLEAISLVEPGHATTEAAEYIVAVPNPHDPTKLTLPVCLNWLE